MFSVAAPSHQGAVGDGIVAGELSDLHLPVGTWHAYLREGGVETACGIALGTLHLFEGLPFLPVRAVDVCEICLEGVRAVQAGHPENTGTDA